MSETGKARRLARMFNAGSGRMLCLAFDHGMQVGTIPGIEDPGACDGNRCWRRAWMLSSSIPA